MKDKKAKSNYDDIGLGNYNKEKLSREDILYPSMQKGELAGGAAQLDNSQYRQYIENLKETDRIKRYENTSSEMMKQNLYEKSIEAAPKWDSSYNAKFSDSELKQARKFIQGEENFRAEAYLPTTNDVWTIGYGHTGKVDGKPITKGMKITREKAEELYRKDFEAHTAGLKEVQIPLTNNQKIALSSFMYNLGPNILKKDSNLLEKLNAGDINGFVQEMEKYNKQRNKTTGKYEVLRGLVNRRKKEKELFLTPDIE